MLRGRLGEVVPDADVCQEHMSQQQTGRRREAAGVSITAPLPDEVTRLFQLGCLAVLTAQNVLISQCLGYVGRTSGETFSTPVLQLHSELIKFVVSGAVLLRREPSSLQSSIFASRAAMPMAVPACLYFLQNCLGLFAFK